MKTPQFLLVSMILPGKHLSQKKSLIGLGAEILTLIGDGISVSELWEKLKTKTDKANEINFDWFVLSLSFLYAINALKLENGVILMEKK